MCKEAGLLQKLIGLCSRYGYIHPSCDLGRSGVKGCYDYGPLGTLLRRNIQNEWWTSVVSSQEDMFGIESSQLQQTSIRNTNQSENSSDDINDHRRLSVIPSSDEMQTQGENLNWTLRDSLNQGTISQYYNTLQLVSRRLPFGLAQIGQCFRRTGQSESLTDDDHDRYIFDLPEFTQMTAQFYCSPKTADRWMIDWQRDRIQWWRKFSGAPSSFQMSETKQSELLRTTDIQFQFPWGVETIERISNRGSGELERLQKETGVDFHGREGRKNVLPQVVEMACGLERGILALLLDAYQEKERTDSKGQKINHRMVLRLHVKLAPIKVAVLPIKGTKEIIEICEYLAKELRKGSISCHRVNELGPVIGQHVARFDEMGIPFVVLLSDKTLKTGVVRMRHRDTMITQQLHITEVRETIERHLEAG
ncbi:DNA polymerase subunit gamma-2, mitochondrial-like isoform X2 [Patiria miniata]|uniref:Aminoacyl-transfer RNA synthetases class-II family profile domain-containing protein n=1 Tax=Patiria miniata TaxID=46514 RepID=A0A914ALF6_PATMI|nr:DNA polymerase subunit gamma-2, mitochondrial-like isoform X2 [Patiria miniata]